MGFRKKHTLRAAAALLSAVLTCTAVPAGTIGGPVNALVTDPAGDYDNFAKALQYSLHFYDANMCGPEVEQNSRFKWRANCHTYDAEVPLKKMDSFTEVDGEVGTNLSEDFIKAHYDILNTGKKDGTIDVSGGFHDAGDHVKFGLPEAYSGTTVSWGYYEFPEAYIECGQKEHVETIIRYFCDYFMRCTFREKDGEVVAFCYQVGDGDIDHKYWQLPQNDTMNRPAWFATADNPTTCNVCNTAACLAINYLNFKESDPEYAEKCLDYAKALFDFAEKNPKAKAVATQGPDSYYESGKWEDDYCFAACWLYLITKEQKYIDLALPLVDYYASPSYVYCWNDMWNGVNLLLGIISETYKSSKTFDSNPKELCDLAMEYITVNSKSPYENIDFWGECAKGYNGYMTGKLGTITPQGYFWLNTWGSCRYNTAAQFCMLVYDKYNKGKDKYNEDGHTPLKDYAFTEWAKGQMEYILGKNEIIFLETGKLNKDGKPDPSTAQSGSRCFLTGFNDHSAAYPHHRAASGVTKCEDKDQQLYVLFGALCGGPDTSDAHNDLTEDWIYNEVTIDYNAACPGAAAGLYLHYKDQYPQSITPDFPPVDDGGRGASGGEGGESGGGNQTWVEACGIDNLKPDGSGVTKVSLMVRSSAPKPPEDLTVRYYFDTSEIGDLKLIESKILYDQVQMEAQPHMAEITQPIVWDRDKKYAYIELNWGDYNFVNCGKKTQFSVGLYWGDNWDPTNDPSYDGLKIYEEDDVFFVAGNEVRADNICVYDGGKLIGGTEPDGTQPDTNSAEDSTTSKTTTSTTITTTTSSSDSPNPAVLLGDADTNGTVQIADAVLMARYVAEDSVNITAAGHINADCNKDKSLTVDDVTIVLQFLAGGIKEIK